METAAREADFAIDRTFDAPLDLVWEVWADPKHAALWWGPHGYSAPVYEQDFRTGGKFRIHMLAPDGDLFCDEGYFEEVVPQQRFTRYGTVSIGETTWFEARITIAFSAIGDQTKLSIRQWYFNLAPAAEYARDGATQGWIEMLDRLAAHVAQHRS